MSYTRDTVHFLELTQGKEQQEIPPELKVNTEMKYCYNFVSDVYNLSK